MKIRKGKIIEATPLNSALQHPDREKCILENNHFQGFDNCPKAAPFFE